MALRKKQFPFRRENIPPLAAGIFFLLLILASESSGVAGFFEENSLKVLKVFEKPLAFAGAPFRYLGALLESDAHLVKANQRLAEENRRLQETALELQSLKSENEYLRQILRSAVFYEHFSDLRVAHLIGSSPSRPKEIIYLSAGRKAGVSDEDLVILPDKTLVGKVSVSRDESSVVETLLSPGIKIAVRVGSLRVQGLFESGSKPKVSLLPKDALLKTGEAVVTSGEDGNFPAGFLVGKISEIASRPADPFQEASVGLGFSLSGLENFLILKNPLR